jgi:hypothetical protein
VWSHIHYFLPQTLEMQTWYQRYFGAVSEKSRQVDFMGRIYEVDILPGSRMNLTKVDAATAPTKGRALDHIGFEIKNLQVFCEHLSAAGIKFERPYSKPPNSGIATAFFTDPWGTYVELTEGLMPPSK